MSGLNGVPAPNNYWPVLPAPPPNTFGQQLTTWAQEAWRWEVNNVPDLEDMAPLIRAEDAISQIQFWQEREEGLYVGLTQNFVVGVNLPDGKKAAFVKDPWRESENIPKGSEVLSEGLGFAMQMANDLKNADEFRRYLQAALRTSGRGLFAWKGYLAQNIGGQAEALDLEGLEGGEVAADFKVAADADWGSATDADIDIVYELIRAWGFAKDGVAGYAGHEEWYAELAQQYLDQIWANSIYFDGATALLSISSDEGKSRTEPELLTSPSYVSVAKLEAFWSFDDDPAHRWDRAAITYQKMREEIVDKPELYFKLNQEYFKSHPGEAESLSALQVSFNLPAFLEVRTGTGDTLHYFTPKNVAERYSTRFTHDAIRTYWRIAYDAKTSFDPETRRRNTELARKVLHDLGPAVTVKWRELQVDYTDSDASRGYEPEMVLSVLTALAYVAAFGPAGNEEENADPIDYSRLFVDFSGQLTEMYDEDGGYFFDSTPKEEGIERSKIFPKYNIYKIKLSKIFENIEAEKLVLKPNLSQEQIIEILGQEADKELFDILQQAQEGSAGPQAQEGSAGPQAYYENTLAYLCAFVFSGRSAGITRRRFVDDQLRGKQWQQVGNDNILERFEGQWDMLGGSLWLAPNTLAMDNLKYSMQIAQKYSFTDVRKRKIGDVGEFLLVRNDCAVSLLEMGFASEAAQQYTVTLRYAPYPIANYTDEKFLEEAADGLYESFTRAGISQKERLIITHWLAQKNPAKPYNEANPYNKLVYARVLLDYYDGRHIAKAVDVARDVIAQQTNPRLILRAFGIILEGYRRMAEMGQSMPQKDNLKQPISAEKMQMELTVLGDLVEALDGTAPLPAPVAANKLPAGHIDENMARKIIDASQEEYAKTVTVGLYLAAAEMYATRADKERDQWLSQAQLYIDAIVEFKKVLEISKEGDDAGGAAALGLLRCFAGLGTAFAQGGERKLAERAYATAYWLYEGVLSNALPQAEEGFFPGASWEPPEEVGVDLALDCVIPDETIIKNIYLFAQKRREDEEKKLKGQGYRLPRSVFGLRTDVNQMWLWVELGRVGVTDPTKSFSEDLSVIEQDLEFTEEKNLTNTLYQGRVRAHFEKLAYLLHTGEIDRAQSEAENLRQICEELKPFDGQADATTLGEGLILTSEQYHLLNDLYGRVVAILREPALGKSPDPKILSEVQNFVIKNARRFAGIKVFDEKISWYKQGQPPSPQMLLSDIETALETSNVLSYYRQNPQKISRDLGTMQAAGEISNLLAAGETINSLEKIEKIIENCRDILGEDPYQDGWFVEASKLYEAYAWRLAYQGKVAEAESIYRALLKEVGPGEEEYGDMTNATLGLLRDKENAGLIRVAMGQGPQYAWEKLYSFGDMMLNVYYRRRDANADAEELRKILSRANEAFGRAKDLIPGDARAANKQTDVANELGNLLTTEVAPE
ncbi:MAG: hypothetical protein WC901_02245 [Candidatus Margulisiibacteriota bacterium]